MRPCLVPPHGGEEHHTRDATINNPIIRLLSLSHLPLFWKRFEKSFERAMRLKGCRLTNHRRRLLPESEVRSESCLPRSPESI